MSFGIPVRNGLGIGLKASTSVGTRSGPAASPPGAPTSVSATSSTPTTASVSFTAPVNPGVPPIITGYTVTSSPGGITATGSASPITVTGLTSGTTYTFTVTATNAAGTGPASAASNSVTPALTVSNVFSTSLYTGTGAAQTITNGIDLVGSGGLVWLKRRGPTSQSHGLFDTARGENPYLSSDLAAAQVNFSNGVVYNSNGFTNKATSFFGGSGDGISQNYASWTFRKAPKFFDVVTYTGDGTLNPSRSFNQTLGVKPGFIIVKATGATGNWYAVAFDGTNYRRSSAATDFGLNSTNAATAILSGSTTYLSTTDFQLGAIVPDVDATPTQRDKVNAIGVTYVAYLFAHNPAADGFIQCGSYTGNGSATGPVINLGWQPQWLMVKRASGGSAGWFLIDNMRGFSASNDSLLYAESSAAEETGYNVVNPTATGFDVVINDPGFNASASTYIYMAIRSAP